MTQGDPLSEAIDELRATRETHLRLGKYMIEAYGGVLYVLDILAIASLNRSLSLLSAFCDLIEKRNFIAAAPMIRMQLDNALRMSAAYISSDPHKFSLRVLEGTPVNRLNDRSGKRMTDRYLVSKVGKQHAWVERVYEATSGYIHLSEKHIFNSIQASGEETRDFEMKISDQDEFVSLENYLEAVAAFREATELFFEYIFGWAYTKDNPELVADVRRLARKSGISDT